MKFNPFTLKTIEKIIMYKFNEVEGINITKLPPFDISGIKLFNRSLENCTIYEIILKLNILNHTVYFCFTVTYTILTVLRTSPSYTILFINY